MANFSERLRGLRTKHGMSQDAVGKIIGVTRYSVCGYEKGKNFPEVLGLIGLAEFFDVSIDYLVGRTDNPEINR